MKLRVFVLFGIGLYAGAGFGATSAPVAQVRTQAVRMEHLARRLTVYGQVDNLPRARVWISAAGPVRVVRLLVNPGEVVAPGQALIEVAQPRAFAAYRGTRAALRAAAARLEQARRLAREGLSTRARLAAARATWIKLRADLAALVSEGASRPVRLIRARQAATVTAIRVEQGQWVAAGQPLLGINPTAGTWIRLGLTARESTRVRPGMPVALSPVFGRRGSSRGPRARIRSVGRQVNPASGFVDAIVYLQHNPGLLPGEWLRARITTGNFLGWLVPESSLLPGRGGYHVFVVRRDRAMRVPVKLLVMRRGQALVSGRLRGGERVVNIGNHELKDGMLVREIGQ